LKETMDKFRGANVLALYHLKGGVGKTASAVNLAYLAATSGLKTLLCDLDPQSSSTYYFRVRPKLKAAKKVFLKGGGAITRNIKGTDYEGLDLLPADWSNRHLAVSLGKVKGPKKRLQRILEPLREEYELIILDCPATMTLVAENIFHAADLLLIPVVPSTLAARTYSNVRAFFQRKDYDERKIHAFFSMVEKRKRLHQATMRVMREQFEGILESYIPYAADVESMGLARAPLPACMPTSTAAGRYRDLWKEIDALMRSGGGSGVEPSLSGSASVSMLAEETSRKADD
jgi:chromosome partitioning protein